MQSSWASGVSIWRNRALLLFALAFATLTAHAATIHVPADQPTIQAGINAANPGDTVLVAPGTYYENIDFKGKAITVTSSGGAATTIIDGGSTTGFATVAFITGETRASIISNMTIRNGGSAAQSAFPEVAGGIYAYKSAPTILNNIITANRCSGVTNDTAAALIQGNNISATIALTTDFCTLDHGNAILEFGYTASFGLNIVPTIAGNIIENNVQGIYGETGGIYLWGADGTIIQGNTIRNNNGTQAGAIASNNINLVSILQNLIYGNSGGDAGAINLAPPEDTTGPFIGIIAGNTIAGNTVTSSSVYPGNTPASQVFLQGNLAQYLLVNNIIVGNKAGTAALNCDVSYEYLAITPLVFDHNDIYAGPGSSYGGSCPDQTGSYGNINADPSFSNPTGNDYTLRSGSPAIDTGNNSAPQMTSTDFAGSPRIQDATGKDYPVVDMGVYEFSGLKNASPTTLLLTPSNYFDPDYTILHPNQPLTFTSTLLSAAGIPSGPVTIDVDGAAATTVLVGPSGTATFSLPTLTPGLHAFTSTYPGSGIFPPAVSVKFFLLIPPVATTLTLKSSPNPSIVGQTVTFTVTTSATDGSVPTPIILTDTTANTILGTLSPNSSGVATFTTSTLTTGIHTITASYAGTGTYSAASATVNQQVLSGYSTTTIVTSSLNPANYGQSVTFNATITGPSQTAGAPTGSVQFNDGTTLLGTQPLSVTPGDVSYTTGLSTSALGAGAHTITATYVPNGGFSSSSAVLTQTIIGYPTTTTVTCAPAPATSPLAIAYTITVTSPSGIPTGSISFSPGTGATIPSPLSSNGSITEFVAYNTAGTYTATATYVPTGGYAPSSATCTATVASLPTTTTFTATPTTAYAGQPITLNATTSGSAAVPTGTVTFVETAIGTSHLVVDGTAIIDTTGHAILNTSTLSIGTHIITASYPGNSIYAASTSNSVTVTILANPSDFTLTLPNPTLTIKTGGFAATTAVLTSLNGFTDNLVINCPVLPAHLYCIGNPFPIQTPLSANGTVNVALTISTIPLPTAANVTSAPFTLAALLSPFSLFAGILAFRRRTPLRLVLLLLAILPAAISLTGCGVVTIPYTPPGAPGTYTIPITATGITTGITHTAQLTVTVTP